MKNLFFLALLVVICFLNFGCEENVLPPTAKEGFELLSDSYKIPFEISNENVNFFKKSIESSYGSFLFFKNNSNSIILGDVTKSSWSKGLKDVCCVCEYGGSVLPGSNTLRVYSKTSMELLRSPSDSLIFNDARISNQIIFIELLSTKNYIDNLDDNNKLLYPKNIKKYYGKYVVFSGKIVMDR